MKFEAFWDQFEAFWDKFEVFGTYMWHIKRENCATNLSEISGILK